MNRRPERVNLWPGFLYYARKPPPPPPPPPPPRRTSLCVGHHLARNLLHRRHLWICRRRGRVPEREGANEPPPPPPRPPLLRSHRPPGQLPPPRAAATSPLPAKLEERRGEGPRAGRGPPPSLCQIGRQRERRGARERC